jgi:hypothetical protein
MSRCQEHTQDFEKQAIIPADNQHYLYRTYVDLVLSTVHFLKMPKRNKAEENMMKCIFLLHPVRGSCILKPFI